MLLPFYARKGNKKKGSECIVCERVKGRGVEIREKGESDRELVWREGETNKVASRSFVISAAKKLFSQVPPKKNSLSISLFYFSLFLSTSR